MSTSNCFHGETYPCASCRPCSKSFFARKIRSCSRRASVFFLGVETGGAVVPAGGRCCDKPLLGDHSSSSPLHGSGRAGFGTALPTLTCGQSPRGGRGTLSRSQTRL